MPESCRSRILVWGLSNNRGGTETVIATYVKALPQVKFDFLCYEYPDNFKDLIELTDNECFVIPEKLHHPLANHRSLNSFMKERGGYYSALWFNVTNVANIDVLKAAYRVGIPRRVVHIHNAKLPDVFLTRLFSGINQRNCMKLATDRWACSEEAGRFLFGDRAFRVVPNYIDADKVAYSPEKRAMIRKEWEMGDSFVVGTVGRLAEEKNQQYLIRLLPKLQQRKHNVKLVLVGAGEKEAFLRQLAASEGVEDDVIFTGSQADVQGYLSAFDVFVFPSLSEGLGVSALEAQFNGLPCVVSEFVPSAANISNSFATISLSREGDWVDALVGASREQVFLNAEKAAAFDLRKAGSFAMSLFSV